MHNLMDGFLYLEVVLSLLQVVNEGAILLDQVQLVADLAHAEGRDQQGERSHAKSAYRPQVESHQACRVVHAKVSLGAINEGALETSNCEDYSRVQA